MGEGMLRSFRDHTAVITKIIPEFALTVGFNQKSRYHDKDVWRHTLLAVSSSKKDLLVRLALFFHDIGKPLCYSEGQDGIGRFHGHSQKSAEMAVQIMTRLRYDNDTIRRVERLVRCQDFEITPDTNSILRWLNTFGEEEFRRLMAVDRGDMFAHAPWFVPIGHARIDKVKQVLLDVLEQGLCYRLKDLAVNGRDLIALGVKEGQAVGAMLDSLLDQVIDQSLPNEREALLEYVRQSLQE
jgi:tRNA nucleotidyltransferase (CCA-adding enzyme)